MHITFVVNDYPPGGAIGGIVTYTKLMAPAWLDAGHKVSVVAWSRDGSRHDDIVDGVRVVRVPPCAYPGSIWDKIRFRFHGDNSHRLLHHKEFSHAVAEELSLWKDPPDIIESPEAFAWGWGVLGAGKAPVVMRVHGPNYLAHLAAPMDPKLRAAAVDSLEINCLRRAKAVITSSRYMKEELLKQGVTSLEPVPLPLSMSLEPGPRDPHLLMAVGRVIHGKGFETVVRLLKVLGKPWRTVIVGPDGGARQELEMLARSLNVADRLVFTGQMDHKGTLDLIRGAGALVHDSRNDSVSYVILEALALNVPVVASRVGGIPEILESFGELLTPGDLDGYARAIRYTAGTRASTRTRILDRHNPAILQRQLGVVYGALVTGT